MSKIKKSLKRKPLAWEEHRRELMKDPKVKEAFLKLQPEFAIVRKIIESRVRGGVTQEELAQRMKTKQSAISRLESGRANPSLNFLQRLAAALDSRLEIRFLPK